MPWNVEGTSPSIHGAAQYCFSGGEKTGESRFYEHMIPIADRLYTTYLEELKAEGLL